MEKERISVAMATYNGARFLREQLDSLYKQTRVPDEVFVSDDNSKDETANILEEYHQQYGLRYVVNKRSLGVNKNFEQAIRSCTGDYIIICDQDDVWFPNKIQVSLDKIKEIEKDKPALVSSQNHVIDGQGNVIDKTTKIQKDTFTCADTLLQPDGVTRGCSLMFNRKLLERLNPFPATEDCLYDHYIGVVSASIGVKYNLSAPLMYHRRHGGNVTVPPPFIDRRSKFRKLLSKLKLKVNPLVLNPNRVLALRIVEREYSNSFLPGVSGTYRKAFDYFECKTKIAQIISIVKMGELSLSQRCHLIIGTLMYFQKFK